MKTTPTKPAIDTMGKTLFTSEAILIGRTWWRMVVIQSRNNGVCCDYEWYEPCYYATGSGYFHQSSDHPRYNGNDTYNGLPRGLKKLWDAHNHEYKSRQQAA